LSNWRLRWEELRLPTFRSPHLQLACAPVDLIEPQRGNLAAAPAVDCQEHQNRPITHVARGVRPRACNYTSHVVPAQRIWQRRQLLYGEGKYALTSMQGGVRLAGSVALGLPYGLPVIGYAPASDRAVLEFGYSHIGRILALSCHRHGFTVGTARQPRLGTVFTEPLCLTVFNRSPAEAWCRAILLRGPDGCGKFTQRQVN